MNFCHASAVAWLRCELMAVVISSSVGTAFSFSAFWTTASRWIRVSRPPCRASKAADPATAG
jgi:hypothetical protein